MLVASCGLESDHLSDLQDDNEFKTYKAFAYYEGLSPTGTRTRRTDGTYHNMPCIKEVDLGDGDSKVYNFWHSHSKQHTFELTADHFSTLTTGEDVEVFTNVVDGHRHAVRVEASQECLK